MALANAMRQSVTWSDPTLRTFTDQKTFELIRKSAGKRDKLPSESLLYECTGVITHCMLLNDRLATEYDDNVLQFDPKCAGEIRKFSRLLRVLLLKSIDPLLEKIASYSTLAGDLNEPEMHEIYSDRVVEREHHVAKIKGFISHIGRIEDYYHADLGRSPGWETYLHDLFVAFTMVMKPSNPDRLWGTKPTSPAVAFIRLALFEITLKPRSTETIAAQIRRLKNNGTWPKGKDGRGCSPGTHRT